MIKHLSLATGLTAILVGAGSAAAIVETGQGVKSVTNISEASSSEISSAVDTNFTDVPGAVRTLNVAAPNDFFTVTFNAESRCCDDGGAASGHCSIRIVATQNNTVAIFRPNPAAGGGEGIRDFAFDSNPTGISNLEEWESLSVTRSARLPAGQWTIRVQRAIEAEAGTTAFRLDDWLMSIIVSD
jgi:hypothetical protein